MASNADQDIAKLKDDLAQLRADFGKLSDTLNSAAREQAGAAQARVRESVAQGRERLHSAEQQAEQQIASHPLQSVGVAFGIGFLIGRLTR